LLVVNQSSFHIFSAFLSGAVLCGQHGDILFT
jgi:hypothetical protein